MVKSLLGYVLLGVGVCILAPIIFFAYMGWGICLVYTEIKRNSKRK